MAEPGGWIAFEVLGGLTNSSKFWLTSGNMETGIISSTTYWNYDALNVAADDANDPNSALTAPADTNFAPFIEMRTKVERDYQGINSSGGPQVAGRADHDEIEIDRKSDIISPVLFQFVSTGEAFSRVYLVLKNIDDETPRVEWLLEGVNVTSYSFTGGHYWSDTDLDYTPDTAFGSATTMNASAPQYYQRIETFRLLYTTAQMRVGIHSIHVDDSTTPPTETNQDWAHDFRGWNTGTNTRMTEDDYPTASDFSRRP